MTKKTSLPGIVLKRGRESRVVSTEADAVKLEWQGFVREPVVADSTPAAPTGPANSN